MRITHKDVVLVSSEMDDLGKTASELSTQCLLLISKATLGTIRMLHTDECLSASFVQIRRCSVLSTLKELKGQLQLQETILL